MPSLNEITPIQLNRLLGTPKWPLIVDLRLDEDFALDPRLVPASFRHDHRDLPLLADRLAGRRAILSCQKGRKLSHGAAAWLRAQGVDAEVLEGGFLAWRDANLPLINTDQLPSLPRPGSGSLWVTRHRPKIDRLACPWLIRRFIDPDAGILYVPPQDVADVADRFCAIPFDVEGVHFSHRGEQCSFDAFLDAFGLKCPTLEKLALIIRAADTNRLDLAPEAKGILALSLGLSRMYRDDQEQLNAAMGLYDALYRWARDAEQETHDWPTPSGGR